MKRAVIFSNGAYNSYGCLKKIISDDDYIICADGAISHCLAMGIIPDLWIGDFDSCNFDELINNHPELQKTEFRKLNCRKDETDTHVACDIACDLGFECVLILGAFGKRIDHMMANIFLLEYMHEKNVMAYLADEKNRVSFLSDSVIIKKERKYLSIVPIDPYIVVEKVSGLEYTLKNEKLFRNESRGISNEITGDYAQIKLTEGRALIIESDD